jgi:hypothetical protein
MLLGVRTRPLGFEIQGHLEAMLNRGDALTKPTDRSAARQGAALSQIIVL